MLPLFILKQTPIVSLFWNILFLMIVAIYKKRAQMNELSIYECLTY